jgi:hypothetical protein
MREASSSTDPFHPFHLTTPPARVKPAAIRAATTVTLKIPTKSATSMPRPPNLGLDSDFNDVDVPRDGDSAHGLGKLQEQAMLSGTWGENAEEDRA